MKDIRKVRVPGKRKVHALVIDTLWVPDHSIPRSSLRASLCDDRRLSTGWCQTTDDVTCKACLKVLAGMAIGTVVDAGAKMVKAERDNANRTATQAIKERDEVRAERDALREVERDLVKERDEARAERDAMLKERDEAGADAARCAEQRDRVIKERDQARAELDAAREHTAYWQSTARYLRRELDAAQRTATPVTTAILERSPKDVAAERDALRAEPNDDHGGLWRDA